MKKHEYQYCHMLLMPCSVPIHQDSVPADTGAGKNNPDFPCGFAENSKTLRAWFDGRRILTDSSVSIPGKRQGIRIGAKEPLINSFPVILTHARIQWFQ